MKYQIIHRQYHHHFDLSEPFHVVYSPPPLTRTYAAPIKYPQFLSARQFNDPKNLMTPLPTPSRVDDDETPRSTAKFGFL